MRIDFQAVTKCYGARVVLNQVTTSIRSRAVTALVGPSGAGKTTLLSLTAGTTIADSGEIVVHSDAFQGRPHPRFVAWVPQGANALPRRTARDNVAIGALARGATWDVALSEAEEALRVVGIGHLRSSKASQLSGGELQRLSFARAICARRPLVLADEPTANLDEANTQGLCAMLQDMSGIATVVVATHDPLVVAAADHVLDVRELSRHE